MVKIVLLKLSGGILTENLIAIKTSQKNFKLKILQANFYKWLLRGKGPWGYELHFYIELHFLATNKCLCKYIFFITVSQIPPDSNLTSTLLQL